MPHPYFLNGLSALSSKLFITREALQQHLVAMEQAMAFFYDPPTYQKLAEEKMLALKAEAPANIELTDDYANQDIPESVAFHWINGMIMYDSYWYFSTKRFVLNFLAAEANPKILSHIIVTNSGGGMAYYCEEVAKMMRAATKPVVNLTEQYACSAALYLTCNATKSYALTEFDTIGSIGVMCSYLDLKPYFEKMGARFIELYATASTHKNKKIRDAENGEPDALIKNDLDPVMEAFAATVRLGRPATADAPEDAHVFNGETFYAPQAQQHGLIDGIRSFDQAVTEAYELGMQTKRIYSLT